MIDLNERAKTIRIAHQSINKRYKDKLSDKEKTYIITQLLKSLIKYKANRI
jgi:hypothetical protein